MHITVTYSDPETGAKGSYSYTDNRFEAVEKFACDYVMVCEILKGLREATAFNAIRQVRQKGKIPEHIDFENDNGVLALRIVIETEDI